MHVSARSHLIRLAWRNVLRNWRHSLATIMAVASGFMAIALFDGFLQELSYQNFDGYTARGMLGHLIAQKRGVDQFGDDDPWQYALNRQEQEFLEQYIRDSQDINQRVRFLSLAGMVNLKGQNGIAVGYGFDVAQGKELRGERWGWDAISGKPLDLASQNSIMLAQGLARILGCQSSVIPYLKKDGTYLAEERPLDCPSYRLTLSATTEAAQVNAIDLTVAGTFDASFREADLRAVKLDIREAQKLLDTDKITLMSLQLKDPDQADRVQKDLQSALAKANLDVEIKPWFQHRLAASVQGGLEILAVFRNIFLLVVIVIVVMSVFNTMMKSVTERIREIGTLRSFGFTRSAIMELFAFEGLFLSAFAIFGGLLASLLLSRLINILGITYKAGFLSTPIPLAVRDAPFAWAISALILMVLAAGTSIFCARKAARMVIAAALRHV